jgi:hypothetical protein
MSRAGIAVSYRTKEEEKPDGLNYATLKTSYLRGKLYAGWEIDCVSRAYAAVQ